MSERATEATETTEANTLEPQPQAVDGRDDLAARIEALEQQAHRGEAAVELLDELAEANQEVRIARSDWANKREATKAAKSRLDAANERLSTIVEGWENDSKRPLFQRNTQTQPVASETQADSQEWRSRSLTAAAFSEKAQDALESAGIHTLGELQDQMTRHGMNWASENGVHGRYREAIEKNFNRYLNEIQADQATPVEALQQPEAAMDSDPSAQESAAFEWPQDVEDKTVAGLTAHGISTLDELRDWAGVRPIEEIPGVTPEQAKVLAGLLAGEAAPADWRQVAPSDAGICKRACTALEKENLTTMGQVVDWVIAGGVILKLKAVGEPTAQKAAVAIRDFCADHGLDDPFAQVAKPTDTEGVMESDVEDAGRKPALDTSDPDGVDGEFNEEIGDEDEDNYLDEDDEDYFADEDDSLEDDE